MTRNPTTSNRMGPVNEPAPIPLTPADGAERGPLYGGVGAGTCPGSVSFSNSRSSHMS